MNSIPSHSIEYSQDRQGSGVALRQLSWIVDLVRQLSLETGCSTLKKV